MTHPPASPTRPECGGHSHVAAGIARGTRRLLLTLGLATVTEMPLANGRRADIAALSDKGEVWIVEIKSSVVDFRTDSKWREYEPFADRLLFAVGRDFPVDILPTETGLVLADPYGGELMREAPLRPLPAARRKAMTLRIARAAALRLHAFADPEMVWERVE